MIQKSVHTALMTAIIGGIIVALIGVPFAKDLLRMMDTPESVIDKSVVYMRIILGGNICSLVYNFGAAIMRASGDSRRPLFYITASGVLNVLLNLFFVLVLHLDVAGVALATVIALSRLYLFVHYPTDVLVGAVLGIGIGGTANIAANLAKEAACLRTVGSHNPDPQFRKIEEDLYEALNSLGVGIMGIGGDTSVLGVNVEYAYTHIAGICVAISSNCMVARRGSFRVCADGTVEEMSSPDWFIGR